ncbi:bifunctional (p)ppGpp synthetase/guanosine-3',5'-bis(diphosphate) 3'-pyrophosphohydrolase [Sinanaerobacter sp. ZZT-01]|uniref:RelA/SpoT family protein n=1 Tax=Sinanaerobacter sp. ZZT-01 TaxID=3111540 RepID=UPI002D78323E|nr:bifunctional (p)ppGpp synthetase/guanosine-3',5'-bis(diphosphate) 3'-pyrophosphohydrolase [Sinanaerobacter sp. ZZT-01]WRR93158.1 bifunctional (p)ppGpp synthetase/guanosine-3',5'-bis(diphosphate) 3'-pyrophosphohydrolase [Sinanaerobacter sp. ZZT-01]
MMEQFLNYLLNVNPNYDLDIIERAYKIAERQHEGQYRKSGEPYLIHPVEVAKILADLGMDENTIIAGLLHDAVEDTPYTQKDLERDFGEEVALLVDGVTKLGSLVYESKEERQAENLRKMFLAMSKDIRVLIIKLADRLHNLRTINYMTEDKIIEKCKETLEIYAPLASRLGIYTIKFEVEDIALKMLEPESYYNLVAEVKIKKQQREENINRVMDEIRQSLDGLSIAYEITGRSKHFYSIYRKMKYQHKQLDEIFDLTAVRIIVDTIKDCYAVLGIVHTMWKPLPGRFKDYIAMPKPNLYQSLHTTVLGDNGEPFEIQIRTKEMHKIAEYGIAAHWKYKEGISHEREEVKLAWLRQTLEWQKDLNDPKEFMETLKVDLFSNQVFVFTPKGDVIELPAGSTPLDFAFKIHSAVGAKCIGAKVNGKMVPIDYTLSNGQIVDIVTSSNSKGPSIDWLKIAKSNTARNKIRAWLKKENKSESSDKGKEMLDKYAKRKGYDLQQILKNQYINKAAKALNYSNTEDLYTAISYGGVILSKVMVMLEGYYHEEKQAELKKKEKEQSKAETKRKQRKINPTGVTVEGVDNLLIRFSKCCNPVPGDEIVGFITKGRGISVHRKDCINILSLPENERKRFIHVEWDQDKKDLSYDVDIIILAEDRKGLFSDLSRLCEDMDVHITGVNAKSAKDRIVNITMTLSISNTSQMEKVLRSLRSVQGVADVYRAIT